MRYTIQTYNMFITTKAGAEPRTPRSFLQALPKPTTRSITPAENNNNPLQDFQNQAYTYIVIHTTKHIPEIERRVRRGKEGKKWATKNRAEWMNSTETDETVLSFVISFSATIFIFLNWWFMADLNWIYLIFIFFLNYFFAKIFFLNFNSLVEAQVEKDWPKLIIVAWM